MNAIEIQHLTKKFGSKLAVNDLNLTIRRGETFALLGVNGAGKTTTIKMLTGLIAPTAGNACIMGRDLATELPAIKALTNVSPQETAIAPNLTVRENLEMMAELYGANRAEASARADEMSRQFDLGEVENTSAKTLSGGWQRRLSIAMALITQPELLFLDEPTLGLDVIARRALWKTLESLKGTITMILTTHYMEEAEALSDRIGIMANGRLKAVGTAAELVDRSGQKNFEDAFVAIATSDEKEVL